MCDRYNRQEQLKSLHQSRKAITQQKADAAILRLIKSSTSINFNSVAKESGLSKATLYNNPNIRKSIEHLREQQTQLPTPSAMKREMREQSKDALIASLKRKIQKLEHENKDLRNQVKVHFAELYEKI